MFIKLLILGSDRKCEVLVRCIVYSEIVTEAAESSIILTNSAIVFSNNSRHITARLPNKLVFVQI